MTRDLILATLRVLSVGFAAYGVAALPPAIVASFSMWAWEPAPPGPDVGLLSLANVLHPAAYLATGGILWASAKAVADRVLPSASAVDVARADPESLAALLFSGVGAFVLIVSVSELSYHGYLSWALARDGLDAANPHETAASFLSGAIKAGLGLALLLGARGWAGAIRRFRRLGRPPIPRSEPTASPPANSAPPSDDPSAGR